MLRLIRLLVPLTALAVGAVEVADAQLPVPPPTQQRGPRDSLQAARDTVKVPPFRIQPPISPLGAFGRSLLLPGWGQAILGRRVTGAFFVFWEGLTLTMTLKAAHQLDYIETTGDREAIDAKKQEIQDWAVLLIFNHLVAGAEAFASAYLWDFPVELEQRVLPGERVGVGARLRF
jgi:hypothetical protein